MCDNKRKLPPWMLPKVSVASTSASNSDNAENNCSLEKGVLAKAPDLTANAGSAPKKKAGTRSERETSKCEVKRRRKLSQQDVSSDKDITQRDKKTNRKTSLKKSQIVEAFSDDDMELTIEDMMAIAEEHVKHYENEHKEPSRTQCESVKKFPVISELESSLDSHCERKRSSTQASEGVHDSTLNKCAELVVTGTSQTGNPAQDMLDLFLGPLLRKPLEEKNKSMLEGMEFSHEFTRKSEEEFVEEMVPLMKKKAV